MQSSMHKTISDHGIIMRRHWSVLLRMIAIAVAVLGLPFVVFLVPAFFQNNFLVSAFWLIFATAATLAWISMGYRVAQYLLSGILITERYIKVIHQRSLWNADTIIIARDHIIKIETTQTTLRERLFDTRTVSIFTQIHANTITIADMPRNILMENAFRAK